MSGKAELNPEIDNLRRVMTIDEQDMRILTSKTAVIFRRHERRHFATEGEHGGATFEPLSPAYAEWKERKRPGRKIMQFDGELRRSLVNTGHPWHVEIFLRGPWRIILGTMDPKAGWHGPGPDHNPVLPVRDVIAHTAEQMRRYYSAIAEYLIQTKLRRVLTVFSQWSV